MTRLDPRTRHLTREQYQQLQRDLTAAYERSRTRTPRPTGPLPTDPEAYRAWLAAVTASDNAAIAALGRVYAKAGVPVAKKVAPAAPELTEEQRAAARREKARLKRRDARVARLALPGKPKDRPLASRTGLGATKKGAA